MGCHSFFILLVVICFLLFGKLVGHRIHYLDRNDYDSYNDKDAEHTFPHILKREKEAVKVEIIENIHLHTTFLKLKIRQSRQRN